MRKILFILLLLPFAASSQVKQLYNQYGGTWKRLEVKVGFRLPMNDSSTKDFNSAAFDSAQVYYNPIDSTIYYYTGFQWLAVGTGTGTNIYNSNGILTGNRTLTGLNNTRSLTFDSLDYFSVNRNGVIRMYMSSTMSSLYSPSGVNSIIANNSYSYLNFNGGVNYLRVLDTTLLHIRASYEGNIHSTFYPYSLVDKSYVDSLVAAGGGTPTLTSTQIAYGDGSNLMTSEAAFTYETVDNILDVYVTRSNELMLIDFNSIGTPPSGYTGIYSDSHGRVYAKNDAGTVLELSNVAGSSGTLSRIGTLDSLVKVANGMQVSGVSIIPQTSDSTYAGLLKNIDYNRNFKYKVQYNPTGTITHNQDSCGQEQFYFTSTGGRTLAFSGLRRGDITVLTFNNSSGSNITLTLPSNSFVNYVSAATVVIPTGQSALNLYTYDGTSSWFIQSSANAGTAAGSDKQVQYNNTGATDGATGFEYQAGASPNVKIQAQNAAYTALNIKAAGSQSVDIAQWQNSAGTVLGRIDAGGGLRVEGALSAPSGGPGAEIFVLGGAAYHIGYDRGGSFYVTTYLDGLTRINYAGSTKITTGPLGAYISAGTAVPNSTLQVGGSLATAYTGTATGITLDDTHSVVAVTATGQTITLPTAVGITGRIYTIKLTASGSATVATTSSQNIDSATTYSLASQYKFVTVMSTGGAWIVIGSN